MNNKKSTLFFALCSLYLSACSTTSSDASFTPLAAEPDQVVVYIYRPAEMANALYSPGLNIDGEFRFYAKNSVSSRLSLTAGEHIFEFQDEKKYSDLTPVSLNLEAGITYFIRVDTSLEIKNTTSYEPYQRSFKLTLVDKQQAVKEISACCLNNKSTSRVEEKSSKNKQGDGFSVDKTQNPFSH